MRDQFKATPTLFLIIGLMFGTVFVQFLFGLWFAAGVYNEEVPDFIWWYGIGSGIGLAICAWIYKVKKLQEKEK